MSNSKAKTDLTKQELMRIFEEQIELKNAEIQRLEGVLSDIRKHYERRPLYPQKETRTDYLRACIAYDDWIELVGVLLSEAKTK